MREVVLRYCCRNCQAYHEVRFAGNVGRAMHEELQAMSEDSALFGASMANAHRWHKCNDHQRGVLDLVVVLLVESDTEAEAKA